MKKFIYCVATLLVLGNAHAGWRYTEDTDSMTSKRTTHALLESSNSLALDSPYKGQNNGTLTVRKHPSYGTDVIFSIEQGQLMCHASTGCPLKVRFDDKPPMNFSGSEPSDLSSTHIFISNSGKFIAEASKAKRILVQANIYKNGAPVLEFFAPDPLVWKPRK